MLKEEWREIPSLPYYQASSFGRVKNTITKNILKAYTKTGVNDGHRYPRLRVKKDGKYKTVLLHHLICAAFHGPRPVGNRACHEDDDPQNCLPNNLYWGTKADNVADAHRNGSYAKGWETRRARCN